MDIKKKDTNLKKKKKTSNVETENPASVIIEDLRLKEVKKPIYPPVLPTTDSKGSVSLMSIEDAKKLKQLYIEEKERRLNFISNNETEDSSKTTNFDSSANLLNDYVDEEGLQECLDSMEIQLGENVHRIPWLETLDYTLDEAVCSKEKIYLNEDIKREARFAELTEKAMEVCLSRLHKADIQFSRPKDFYADMLKTDYQMQKIKAHLADESEKMKLFEKRKEQKFQKKFTKQLKANKLKQQQINKAKHLEKIELLKKAKYGTTNKKQKKLNAKK